MSAALTILLIVCFIEMGQSFVSLTVLSWNLRKGTHFSLFPLTWLTDILSWRYHKKATIRNSIKPYVIGSFNGILHAVKEVGYIERDYCYPESIFLWGNNSDIEKKIYIHASVLLIDDRGIILPFFDWIKLNKWLQKNRYTGKEELNYMPTDTLIGLPQ